MNGLVDLHGPVIRLAPLGREELFVLLHKVRHVYACGNPAKYLIPDEGIEAYRAKCEDGSGLVVSMGTLTVVPPRIARPHPWQAEGCSIMAAR